MDISVYEVMKSGGVTLGNTCCCDFDRNSGDYSGIIFEKGFFFLLVINGTARLSDIYGNYVFLHRVLQAQSDTSMQTFR